MAQTDGQGRNIPFFIDFFELKSILINDFSPIEDPSLSDSEIGVYVDKGFLVRPNADGALYGITLYAYENNSKSLTGLLPEKYLGVDNQWIECRFVKVYSNNVDWVTVATEINVGITI